MKRKPKPAAKSKPAHRGIDCPDCVPPDRLHLFPTASAVTIRRRECVKYQARFTTAERIVNRAQIGIPICGGPKPLRIEPRWP